MEGFLGTRGVSAVPKRAAGRWGLGPKGRSVAGGATGRGRGDWSRAGRALFSPLVAQIVVGGGGEPAVELLRLGRNSRDLSIADI